MSCSSIRVLVLLYFFLANLFLLFSVTINTSTEIHIKPLQGAGGRSESFIYKLKVGKTQLINDNNVFLISF